MSRWSGNAAPRTRDSAIPSCWQYGQVDRTTEAFNELVRNLRYARGLVRGGRGLHTLQVTTFEVQDLYRAAWVMAVAALDHWVHEEIYHRAVHLALRRAGPKPAKFADLDIPMSLFDKVHYESASLEELFTEYLRGKLGFVSYQNPDRIREGFRLVSDKKLWPAVAKVLSTENGVPYSPINVTEQLETIVRRRNAIAHSADRDPAHPGRRRPITADETQEAIDFLETLGSAIVSALGTR